MAIVDLTAKDGSNVKFEDGQIIGSGAMKDVYFSPCKTYVVAFFRNKLDRASIERLEMITGRYRESIFENSSGRYWDNFFCWPDKIVEHNGLTGIVVPAYQAHFFFDYGSTNNDFLKIQGKEKQGKWFASANNQNRFLDDREKGDWSKYLKICLTISRAVRRLHAAGLAHSDLSYKNVLVSPVEGHATIIDVDGLVVPGKYPPDVVGTPDFIAPEVVSTAHLSKKDPKRCLPNISTDRHALAVLIYNYLLLRHPLRGDKVRDLDPQKDESLSMGEKALFVEHPTNEENRIKLEHVKKTELPWKDTKKLPYTITGPYISKLFESAFIDGLHAPNKRPSADDWENAMIKSIDLIQPCVNDKCQQGWYIFDNTLSPTCPFCRTKYVGQLPVINFYSEREKGSYVEDKHRLMVYTNQSLYQWHTNRFLTPNERLRPEQKKRQGYFVFHNGFWYLVNENMPHLIDATSRDVYPIGSQVKIVNGMNLLVGKERGDRLFNFQMVNG